MDISFFKGKKALVVEDNKVNSLMASRMLMKWEIIPDVAENGQIAVDMVMANHYDLILMDIQMPVMDGYEATRAIRTMDGGKFARLPIIAVTATLDMDMVRECGMDEAIEKPLKPEELLEKMLRVFSAIQ